MRVIKRALDMCDFSWKLLVRTLQLSCVMLFCAFVLLMDAGAMTPQNYSTYLLANELFRLPQGLLIISVLGGAVIEDLQER